MRASSTIPISRLSSVRFMAFVFSSCPSSRSFDRYLVLCYIVPRSGFICCCPGLDPDSAVATATNGKKTGRIALKFSIGIPLTEFPISFSSKFKREAFLGCILIYEKGRREEWCTY